VCMCVSARIVCVCVRACARACVCMFVHVCARFFIYIGLDITI